MMEQPDSMTTDRNPFMIFGLRIFGDILPFIGFETVTVDAKEFQMDTHADKLSGTFFTMEWFGKGFSVGRFKVPL